MNIIIIVDSLSCILFLFFPPQDGDNLADADGEDEEKAEAEVFRSVFLSSPECKGLFPFKIQLGLTRLKPPSARHRLM